MSQAGSVAVASVDREDRVGAPVTVSLTEKGRALRAEAAPEQLQDRGRSAALAHGLAATPVCARHVRGPIAR